MRGPRRGSLPRRDRPSRATSSASIGALPSARIPHARAHSGLSISPATSPNGPRIPPGAARVRPSFRSCPAARGATAHRRAARSTRPSCLPTGAARSAFDAAPKRRRVAILSRPFVSGAGDFNPSARSALQAFPEAFRSTSLRPVTSPPDTSPARPPMADRRAPVGSSTNAAARLPASFAPVRVAASPPRAHSSIGQSPRLITGLFLVRTQVGLPTQSTPPPLRRVTPRCPSP